MWSLSFSLIITILKTFIVSNANANNQKLKPSVSNSMTAPWWDHKKFNFTLFNTQKGYNSLNVIPGVVLFPPYYSLCGPIPYIFYSLNLSVQDFHWLQECLLSNSASQPRYPKTKTTWLGTTHFKGTASHLAQKLHYRERDSSSPECQQCVFQFLQYIRHSL